MRKGFTLIELLGVIAILGILSLIVIPIVTNIIETAKEDTERTNKDLYIQAVVNTITNQNITMNFEPQECQIVEETIEVGDETTGKKTYVQGDLLCDGINYVQIESSGKRPVSGHLTIKDGRVVSSTINYK